MIKIFKKNSWILFTIAFVLLVSIGFVDVTNAKKAINKNDDTSILTESTQSQTKNNESIDGKQIYVLPSSDKEFIIKPKVKVPVDLEVEKFEQQQVDQGHKPWRLDPIQTTITFVSLKIYPQGIEGPFPIKEEDLKIIQKTNRVAIVEVSGDITPIRRVYLKRLIRQDNTGIWSVVGYDPVEKDNHSPKSKSN